MTPENLPKTNEEWTLFFKILAWFTGVIFSILGIVKIAVFISKNVFKVIEMIKNYEQLKIEIIKKNEEIDLRLKNLVTYEDLETFQNNCKLQNELDVNNAIKLLSDVVIALNAKVDILLEERGLYENDYTGKRRRKTDLPRNISANQKKH